MIWKPEKPIEYFILALHVIIIVGTFVFEVFHLAKVQAALIGFSFFINILWTVALILIFYLEYKKRNAVIDQREQEYLTTERVLVRKAKYADVLVSMNSAFGEIHQIMRKVKANGGHEIYLSLNLATATPEELNAAEKSINLIIKSITEGLIKLCNHTKVAFSKITNDPDVAVCIKIIIGKDHLQQGTGLPHARTLIRDNDSYYRRGLDPVNIQNQPVLHLLDDNNTSYSTIIKSIINNDPKSFFCNALPLLPKYKNTSFGQARYGEPLKRPGMGFKDEEYVQAWTLPYKSCIVSPLLPDHLKDKELDKLEGFLCVDSKDMGVFDEMYDVHLLAGLSDGVYNKIRLLNELIDKSKKIKELLPRT